MRVAVVGAGVVGLATTAALLRRGVEVTCYERSGAPMAERLAGSSRIFRLAHATPDLVQVAQVAQAGYALWSAEAGAPLVGTGGCVVSGGDWRQWAAAMAEAGAAVEIGGGPGPLAAAGAHAAGGCAHRSLRWGDRRGRGAAPPRRAGWGRR